MKHAMKIELRLILSCWLCAGLLFCPAGRGTALAQSPTDNASSLQAVEPEKRSFPQTREPSRRIKESLSPEQRIQPETAAPFPSDPRQDTTPGKGKAAPEQALPPEQRMYSENSSLDPQQALEPEDRLRPGNQTDPRDKLKSPLLPEQRRLPATPDRPAVPE